MCISSAQPSFVPIQYAAVQLCAVLPGQHQFANAPPVYNAGHSHSSAQHHSAVKQEHSVIHGYPPVVPSKNTPLSMAIRPCVAGPAATATSAPTAAPGVLTFPPTIVADQKPIHTYASFYEEPVPELSNNANGTWCLCLPIAIPTGITNPTLTSLVYSVKYATTHDSSDATVQTDVVLSTKTSPVGIIAGTGVSADAVYRPALSSYGPWVVDPEVALCLSSKASVKKNAGGASWSHFVEQGSVAQKVCVVSASHLYLVLHVVEYPTALTLRTLAVEVAASWREDAEGQRAKEAAEKKAQEEAAKKVKEETERKEREEAERKAKEEAARKAKEVAERKEREEAARKAKEEADRKAQEEAARKAKEEADRKAQEEAARKAKEEADRKAKEEATRKAKEEATRKAKEEADRKAQEEALRKAKEEAERKEAERWAQEEAARVAKEAAARKAKEEADRKAKEEAVKKAPHVADAKMQQTIAEAAKKFNAECPNGFVWTKTSSGYVCGGGAHNLTFQQLGMA
ncbi:hypothetical protein HGRIS_011447 [Hohenbuehelia grisea]|uniref:Uncharacterized protein n=1 Tax=Hohenbuehelia grisea TaxID=104357 RepID=A0ABR3JVB9_9AGAR